jgi:hypothetical protein
MFFDSESDKTSETPEQGSWRVGPALARPGYKLLFGEADACASHGKHHSFFFEEDHSPSLKISILVSPATWDVR